MAAPEYVVRSFGGGAQAAQLLEPMGTTDTSFGITVTTGWTESVGANVGQPLGTSGPFMVVIDRFADTVEKILCSAVNLTTGVVTVYTSGGFSGRGYDGSTPQAHVPNGSTSGVQTGWSADEAWEANQAVSYLLGTAGGTPSTGQILTWGTSAPTWGTTGSLVGNPAGMLAATAQTIVNNETQTQITSMAAVGTLEGGVTLNDNGLEVPVTGLYQISYQIGWQSDGGGVTAGTYQAAVYQNSVQKFSSSARAGAEDNPTSGGSLLYPLAANDVVGLVGYQTSGTAEASAYTNQLFPGYITWLSVAMVNQGG